MEDETDTDKINYYTQPIFKVIGNIIALFIVFLLFVFIYKILMSDDDISPGDYDYLTVPFVFILGCILMIKSMFTKHK